ncbi:MAG: DUF4397 domain-containing protein [Bacteroidia bacterium]
MKKLMLPLVIGMLFAFPSLKTFAQFADVQIIHNAADPAADSVDIYINAGPTPAVPDFKFREATPFIQLPAGVTVNVGIAPGNSTGPGDILATFPFTLTSNEKYVVVATGVLNPAMFDATVNGATAIGFDLKVLTPAQTTGTGGNVDIVVAHGATDAPDVDALVNFGTTPLIDNLAYGTFSGYASVPPAEYILNVTPATNNSTIVASYYADLSGLGGGSAVVFASGFLNPANNMNGAAFGLFAALANGTVIELPVVGNARAQVIHNSADPGAATVDVYINYVSDSLKLDDFAFRGATPFVDLPTGYPVSIGIAPSTSTSSSEAIATFTPTLMDGETYLVVANGVLDPSMFAANPDGASTGFTLFLEAGAKEASGNANVDIKVLHGATDAPSVGVNANGGAVVPAAAYSNFTGYLNVPAAAYRIDVTGANAPGTLVAPFYVDASTLGGGATLVFASGFLDPAANMNGPAFGLFAAFADGTVAPLTPVGNARAQVIHNSADPGAATVDVYINYLSDSLKLDDFAFRGATPFVDLPAGYPVSIGIAPPTSTSSSEAIATFTPTLMDGESYLVVANGVLDPTMFAANPDGASTGFTLFLEAGAKEASGNANVDIKVLHGATDAPSVGVNANGGAVVPAAAYSNFTGYLNVPAAEYRIDVTGANAPGTLVAPFYVDASTLGGGATLVFASGFLDPAANMNGPAFGLFAAFADGTVAPLTPVGNARAQVIHNAADPAAATVDVYVNALADTIKLDDFDFRTATPFVDLPTGYELDIVIALPTSTGITDGVVATIPASLASGGSYHIVANGVISPASFAVNPDGIPTAFGLFVADSARETAVGSNVDIKVFHGATDAPTVDVLANYSTPALVSGAAYTDFTGYLSVPAADYDISITPAGQNTTLVATFDADVTGLGGGAGLILASGFLDPATNQNGEGFGLLLVLPDGTSTLLPLATSIKDDLIRADQNLSVFPNPASSFTTMSYTLSQSGNARLVVLDMAGKPVFETKKEKLAAGTYDIDFSAETLAAGIYTVVLTTETTFSVKRLSIIK